SYAWRSLLTAAGEGHAHEVGRFRRGIFRRILQRQPGGHSGDIRVGQAACDALHTVRFEGIPVADTPARQLRGNVSRSQTDQAWNAWLHAGQTLAMTGDT